MEAWVTADEVVAAAQRFVDAMPGFSVPCAYSVARLDGDGPTFAHVNDLGGTHQLPAVVLATVCGYRSGNETHRLTREAFAEAIRLLSPAEACEAFDHPNLWSWRPLLAESPADATFAAVFIQDLSAAPTSEVELALRRLLANA